jgi:OmpA-OmpF porin, OOP family
MFVPYLLSLLAQTPDAAVAAPAKPAPVVDFDKDGVPDLDDDCPTDPGNPLKKGCPGDPPPPVQAAAPVEIKGDRLELDDTILFKTGSATIDPKSYGLVASVAATLKTLPEHKKVRVEGHTDGQGNPKKNLELSQKRAEAVVAQLVRQGVVRERLSAQGFGKTKPIADNKTAEGRAKNRRVEFILSD